MVKSILKKKTKKTNKTKKQQKMTHNKRVHFNKYKKVKTFKHNKKIKSKKPKKTKTRKGKKINKKKGKKTKKSKNTKRPLKLKLKMKGGCGSNMGEKITGIKLNPQDYQHPESTNLNSSVPYPYQNGGSLWDTFGLGDVPMIKNAIINSSKNLMAGVTGNDKVVTGNPIIHPEMEKSLMKYPQPINLYDVHQQSQIEASSEIKA